MKYTRWIFFVVSFVYNLILGLYLRDFLVLSPTLQVFYFLSFLPTFFLLVRIKSKAMRTVIFVLLALIFCINFAYAVYCRRAFPFLSIISLSIVIIYFSAFVNDARKDNLLTKIYVLLLSAIIIVLLFSAYILVYKQDEVSLTNGQATLWDTQTVELADEICANCDSNEEKIKAIYSWIIHNLEYDYECEPIVQYFNVRKTLSTHKGICYDFAHLFAAYCRSQNIPCYVVDGTKYDNTNYHHTWNRIYFDGAWWNMDVTFDIVQTQKHSQTYGLRNLGNNAFVYDTEYIITRIYYRTLKEWRFILQIFRFPAVRCKWVRDLCSLSRTIFAI